MALTVEDRTVVIPVPGVGRVDDVVLSFGAPRCELVEGAPTVTLPLELERYGRRTPRTLHAVFPDGENVWVSAWRLFDAPELHPSQAQPTVKLGRKTCALPSAVTVDGDANTAVILVR